MAATIYYCASSLDGFIADADDGLDWLTGYEGSYEGEGEPGPMSDGGSYEQFYEGVGALVMGSTTFEWVLDHLELAGGGKWPYAGKPCWVLSSRDLVVPGAEGLDVRVTDAPVADLHPEMVEAAGGRSLWIVGGGGVASQFARAGLLDEVHLTVLPVVLGAGKPLFGEALSEPLDLAGTRTFANGMVELRYTLRTG